MMRREIKKNITVAIGLVASLITILVFTTGKFSIGDFIGKQSIPVPAIRVSKADNIKYDYSGKWALINIASKACAYSGHKLVADAEVIDIIESGDSRPNLLDVLERHYDHNGEVYYEGKITFRFAFAGANVEKNTPIRGKRIHSIFNTWPSGGP
ncbi:MAG: hypothetical protein KAS46_01970 [Candidatus Aureabacteria bacterium]|nr:hypothetical protein [Candidatus Auribacterota bacterium]